MFRKYFLVQCTLVILLAFLCCLRSPSEQHNYLPLVPGRISTARVIGLGDAISTEPGSQMMKVRVCSVQTCSGAVFSADCDVLLVFNAGRPLWLGSSFIVNINRIENTFGLVYGNPLLDSIEYPHKIWQIRAGIREKINSRIPSGREYALVMALLFGDRNDLEAGLPALFRRAGIAHILALSGMHLHFVCSFFLLLFSRFLSRRLAFFLMCPILIFYLYITGPLPSLIRGALFWFVSNTNTLFRFRQRIEFCFLISALLAIMIFPGLISSLSFIFSCAAVGGIMLFSRPVSFFLQKYVPPFLSAPLAAGVAAYSAALPVQIWYWQQTVPTGIFLSVIT
ncbi:MAG: ComEC/Rec2 family competence protein, partial [Spirochaetales bacterium]|nr:ComEC/Rec2 family competence protein [Spirochaetales bacterium]